MNIAELRQLEADIEQARKMVDMGNVLDRLRNNADFKQIISHGYFEQEAIRLVHLMADSNMQSPEIQESIRKQMIAVGTFRDYLDTLSIRADMAYRSLESGEAIHAEVMAEGVEE